MTTNEDQYYINLIIEGHTNAFSTLVDRYKDLVFSLALRMVKNKEEAEEVAQDTFVKVFKSLRQFKGDSKFSTWIYKVTYNTCLDRLKKHKREQHIESIDEFNLNQIKNMDNALDDMEAEERKQAIQDCIKLLPSDDAFLLTLFYFEEESLEEIAKVVNLTENNVKVKLFRIRKKLATILKERLEPEIIQHYGS
ncbi:DNA-directed RNA polymerase sigma-70 factor [Yeosuana aromativorans]|uniref:RNA polymerase sigma factor n=1 Tax=Yeosuana aromativorans TaxID=288019 RepID=A0A8J3BJ27_9FLAO|nr:sigma-70 family RNA polymerase sigma factor [Yeosuana aromativorans]GGK25214.1 DNA-directed RNA polymerase sigma-70 factor [Yeosuana aromativorans]